KNNPKVKSPAKKKRTDPLADQSRNPSKHEHEAQPKNVSVPPLATLTNFADVQKNAMQHARDRNIKAQDHYAEGCRYFEIGSPSGTLTKFLMRKVGRTRLAVTRLRSVFITSW